MFLTNQVILIYLAEYLTGQGIFKVKTLSILPSFRILLLQVQKHYTFLPILRKMGVHLRTIKLIVFKESFMEILAGLIQVPETDMLSPLTGVVPLIMRRYSAQQSMPLMLIFHIIMRLQEVALPQHGNPLNRPQRQIETVLIGQIQTAHKIRITYMQMLALSQEVLLLQNHGRKQEAQAVLIH